MLGPHRLAPGPMLPPVRNPLRTRLHRVLVRLALLGIGIVVLVLVHRPALTGIAGRFRIDDPAPSDAIVLLLGGSDHRPEKAGALYRSHLAPVILLARSAEKSILGINETEESCKILDHVGVPPDAIRVLPGIATSTRDEALYVRDYARSHRLKRITVVTTSFHTARARWIFRKCLRGMGIDVRMAAADHPHFVETDWFTMDEGMVTYFGETIKTIYYRIRY